MIRSVFTLIFTFVRLFFHTYFSLMIVKRWGTVNNHFTVHIIIVLTYAILAILDVLTNKILRMSYFLYSSLIGDDKNHLEVFIVLK